MLSELHIENIAVIRSADISFGRGFTVLTGETGAGKTVIMESLKLLLGGKSDRDLIRRGEEKATVSALFCDLSPRVREQAAELGYDCEDGELLVSRTLTEDGRSNVRINGKSATASIARGLLGSLVDVHGQHDSIMLLDGAAQMRMLDEYASDGELLSAYRAAFDVYTEVRRRREQFAREQAEGEKQIARLRVQVNEIAALKPKEGEEEQLEAEFKRLENLEKIRRQTGFAYRALYGGEKGNAALLVDKSASALASVSDALPQLGTLSERLREIYFELEDISAQIDSCAEVPGGDIPAALEKIEIRISALKKIQKKYGADIPEILSFFEKAKKKLSQLENADDTGAALEKEFAAAADALHGAGAALTRCRTEAAEQLGRTVGEILSFLDMPKVRFSVAVSPKKADADGALSYAKDGADEVSFLMALSDGEPLLPISGTASGGELSRVMLAIRSALSEKGGTATVVYDEIDTGVSGKTARKIGMKLRESSRDMQVLCITHSAQIASLGDSHLLIRKQTIDGRQESGVTVLSREERIGELSRILGGLSVTDAQRRAAEDMLEEQL